MTEPSFYMIYLTAERLRKLVLAAGGRFGSFDIRLVETSDRPAYFWTNHIVAHIDDANNAEHNEQVTANLLQTLPNPTLQREDGKMYLYGQTAAGITYYLWCGNSVCERVQVGTRIVPAVPEHEEPIFEVRCLDPIVTAGVS